MWTTLSDIDPTRSDRYGYKATLLHEPLCKRLPLPSSWVLATKELAALGDDLVLARSAARELLTLAPKLRRFLLRSSSPLEDLRTSSAAGLFESVPCAAREDSLSAGLQTMAASTHAPHLLELLHRGESAPPLAILAQEQLDLDAWCTIELDATHRAGEVRMRVEGWMLGMGGRIPLEFITSSHDTDSEFTERITVTKPELWNERENLLLILNLARQATEDESGIWLLEIGRSAGSILLLQRRPVARAAPLAEQIAMPIRSPCEEPPFLDYPLFAADPEKNWKHDAAHCPSALCPLLAGIFVNWITARGPGHPSRLIHGRWYDLVEETPPEKILPVVDAVKMLQESLRNWRKVRAPRLSETLQKLQDDFSPLPSPAAWPSFVNGWLDWQTLYFDDSAPGLRCNAAIILEELSSTGDSLPSLPSTVATRRGQEMDELALRLRTMDESERELVLEHFLSRHGHVAPGHWNGRAIPWREDPRPLYAELEHRKIAALSPAAVTPGEETTSASEETTLTSKEKDAPALLTTHALALLEDDDDLLARAYAIFRACALDLQAWLHPEAESAEILDLLPDDLIRIIESTSSESELFERARGRGSALLSRWEVEFAKVEHESSTAQHESFLELKAGTILHATPLSQGRGEGELCILSSAQADGGPAAGEILVVPLVLPADAVVFPRCRALVCESGATLGHAAVLAREHGLAAVILPHARQRLRDVRRARVNGDKGEIEILETRKS